MRQNDPYSIEDRNRGSGSMGKSRDFKAEYYRLAEQFIKMGMDFQNPIVNGSGIMLVSENDIQNYQERISREIQRLSNGKSDVFEHLYDQRDRSTEKFEMLKNLI